MKGIETGTPKSKLEKIALGYEKASPEEQDRAINQFLAKLYIREQDQQYIDEMPTGGRTKKIGGKR